MEGPSDRLGTHVTWRHCSQRSNKSMFMLCRHCGLFECQSIHFHLSLKDHPLGFPRALLLLISRLCCVSQQSCAKVPVFDNPRSCLLLNIGHTVTRCLGFVWCLPGCCLGVTQMGIYSQQGDVIVVAQRPDQRWNQQADPGSVHSLSHLESLAHGPHPELSV